MTPLRISVTALFLVAGTVAAHSLRPGNATALQRPLREFPSTIGVSHSEDRPFEADVVRAIGADDYINRVYLGSAPPIELFIGYYKDQTSGDRMHSPQNCLPGSGWEPVHSSRIRIASVNGTSILVNEYLVAQGAKRDMVLYWYQSHGRVIASEYWAKFWLVSDALKHKGTDGALIRIWTTAADGETMSQARAVEFAQRIYPQVAEFLPN
jgi:EpsI family protein